VRVRVDVVLVVRRPAGSTARVGRLLAGARKQESPGTGRPRPCLGDERLSSSLLEKLLFHSVQPMAMALVRVIYITIAVEAKNKRSYLQRRG
jgi:hypothetical protein